MSDIKVPVRPFLRILANGTGTNGNFRFTLIATPEFDEQFTTDDGAFEFENWPKEMALRLRTGSLPFEGKSGIRLQVREIVAKRIPPIDSDSPPGWEQVSLHASGSKAFDNPERWNVINKLWQGALAKAGSDDWTSLAEDIRKSLAGKKHTSSLESEYPKPDLDSAKLDKDGAIIAIAMDAGETANIKGVLPIRQTDLVVEEEGIRAARVLAKQYGGPYAVRDEDVEPEETDFTAKFKDVVNVTNEERHRTQVKNEEVVNLVRTGIKQGQNRGTKPEDRKAVEIVPPVGDVVALANSAPAKGTDREKRRAGHKYGTWLQRRYKIKENESVVAVPEDSERVATSDKIERLRGVYYSLQGDPMLSRLFCLAIDFEVDERELPAGDKLHLAIAWPTSRRKMALVATAARRRNFWPISTFEAHVVQQDDNSFKILDDQAFVEQEGGIWKLGAAAPVQGDGLGSAPRYELASLDLRRSIDAKTSGRDRGEEHHTGGFTILDRGRADQIARDLALSGMQADKVTEASEIIVLHAEELTVGRRVDVAAATAGTKLADLNWRSLMHRYVDFDFKESDKAAEEALSLLLPNKKNKKGLLEEVSFQVAARFMPMPLTPQHFEVVAEEAIYTWDGTPAGVLTDAGVGNRAQPSLLPFGRVLDLPGVEPTDGKLRPPPLRFGVPYVFRFRSMFLGGGSPGPATPETTASMTDFSTVPAALNGTVRPRRFLRHEKISAPVLMLPKRLAQLRRAQMGYEQADQAIIRSWNSEAAGLNEISEGEIIKGEYVDANIRTTPSESMRVFVAPEAPLELVVRHGMLDKGNATAIRRGGLTDVTFAPAPIAAKLSDPPRITPSGFPVAITTRRDTLDSEGAIYRRRVDAAEDSDQRGIPVFEPGGINSTKDGAVGYLPDPAVDSYCIRARIRGSDRYLDGQVLVPLYRGSSYPHALPLVITLEKLGKNARNVRETHPTHISGIAKPATPVWFADSGEFSSSKPLNGTRVQRVRIELYPGEDFDLEVTCLPSASMLAGQFSLTETIAIQLQHASSDVPSLERIMEICGEEVSTVCHMDKTTQALTGLAGKPVTSKTMLEMVATHLLDVMQNKWPVEEIAAVTTMRICHAVNKPPLRAKWLAPEEVTVFREVAPTKCSDLFDPSFIHFKNEVGAKGLYLEGTIGVDLALVDSFQIVAETVATEGSQLDSRERGRSMISKRSGTWPVLTRPDGSEAYISPDDVVGFRVSEDGSVTLPRKSVTLLNVGNLPDYGAIGEIIPLADDDCRVPKDFKSKSTPDDQPPGGPVFGKTERRLTSISIGPLFAAAKKRATVAQQIAMQKGAKDEERRFRLLKIERPDSFKDTLARRLKLSLISVSRFASAFETAPTYFEGKEQALYRRQPLKRVDQAILNADSAEVWLPSTQRPSPPDCRRPEPSFIIERASTTSEKKVTTHSLLRRALTRLYFGRGWFSSGEGERVGIVLWPPRYDGLKGTDIDRDRIKLGDRMLNLENFEDADLGDGGAFVTRWGGDPIREDRSPQFGNFIPPEAFADLGRLDEKPHRPQFVPRALMPIPRAGAPAGANEETANPTSVNGRSATSVAHDSQSAELPLNKVYDYLPVSVLTFEPCFDLDREEWFVDVDLRPIRASEPFVRFGLVRYQEHSISDNIKVSEPVTVTMQLLPDRHVEITEGKLRESEDLHVSIVVRGLGSADIKDLLPLTSLAGSEPDKQKWQDNFDVLRRPKIKLALFHEFKDGNNGLIRIPIVPDGPIPMDWDEESQYQLPNPKLENATLVWSTEFDLTRAQLNDFGSGQIVAYLEEIDLRMPASYRREPVQPATMFEKETFVSSGPRFSARLPFATTGSSAPA